MLLNEVLYIAKNINKYKSINESLKSNILSDILHKFDYSNITVEPVNKSYYRGYTDKGVSFFDVKYEYQRLAERHQLTQDMCDTVEGRQNVINCEYKKKKRHKLWNGTYEDNGIIYMIMEAIKNKSTHKIGLSDITDSELITISPADAKKKIYKTGLQFWVDYDNNLRAVVIDNTIILYIQQLNQYNSWLKPNPNYHEKTDFSTFANNKNDEQLENFINNAFIKIPVYNILTSNVELKKELGANNVKSLQNVPGLSKVYVVNTEGMENSDIEEKLKSRKDYKIFLESQIDLNKKNIERYKNELKLRRSQGIDSKIINKIYDFLDVCMDTTIDLQNLDNDVLTNKSESDFIGDTYWHSAPLDYIYSSALKRIYPDRSFFDSKVRNMYGRGTHMETNWSFNSIGDCLVVANIKIEKCIEYAQSIIDRYDRYNNIKDKADTSQDEILYELNILKSKYKELKDFLTYNSSVYSEIRRQLDKANIDIDKIMYKIDNFQF